MGTATKVAAGAFHTCALTTGGGVKCWGENNHGLLGDGGGGTPCGGIFVCRPAPVDVVGLASGVSAIATGHGDTCALTTGGGVKCWGWNTAGELGDGTTTDRPTPVDVSGLTSGVTAVTTGGLHACALTSGGGVKCWGLNSFGQLGDGTTTNRLTPIDVAGLTSGVTAIDAGEYYTCALTSSGGVKCWGLNSDGQLGDGTTTTRLAPVDVTGLTSGVTAIATGGIFAIGGHTCALTTGGGVKCWGWNTAGELGDGTTTDRLTPVNVSGLSSGVSAIATGEFHTCALMTGGGVLCWGSNDYGELGDGTTVEKLVPNPVNGLSSGVVFIAAGGFDTCAVTSAGQIKCWGENDYGELGDGTGTSSGIPVDVVGFGGACFNLTTSVSPGGGGTITANPPPNCNTGSGWDHYTSGTNVALTATSNSGYAFSAWSGDLTGSTSPSSVAMTADRTVTANFTSAAYSIAGQVTGSSGCISGVSVSDGAGHTSPPSDTYGNYALSGLAAGTYTLGAVKSGCKFWPNAQPIVLSGDATQNFSEWTLGIGKVPVYLQGDPSTPSTLPWHPPWYNQTLLGYASGDTYDTVGRYGCALASYAMILGHYGQLYSPPLQTDPGDLNAHMQGLDPVSFEQYAWSKGVNVFQSGVGPANDFTGLHSQLTKGDLVMLQLGVSGSPTRVHYVVVTGETTVHNQATYTINDPVYGQVTLLGRYGKNDFQAAYYYMLGPTTFNRSAVEISAHSPVQLLVTDTQGRRVGYDPRTGLSYNEIPNAGYVTGAIAGPDGNTLPEFKYVLIPQPSSSSYYLQVIGTGTGGYTIDVIQTDSSGKGSVSRQSGTAQLNSVYSYTIRAASALFLPLIVR
ncbi:MAG: hypothetical protein M1132_10140 [Chloroflexi bacterium]|nr:hypothetical protein [Chloroflexota bacterium]